MGEGTGDAPNCLAESTLGKSGSATTRIVGDDDFEAFVLSTCPQRGLTLTGMTDKCQLTGIGPRLTCDPVCHAAASPRPGSQRLPTRIAILILREERNDTLGLSLGMVWIDILIAHGHDSIAPAHDVFQRPAEELIVAHQQRAVLVCDAFEIR